MLLHARPDPGAAFKTYKALVRRASGFLLTALSNARRDMAFPHHSAKERLRYSTNVIRPVQHRVVGKNLATSLLPSTDPLGAHLDCFQLGNHEQISPGSFANIGAGGANESTYLCAPSQAAQGRS
jgi:hypothetical protein